MDARELTCVCGQEQGWLPSLRLSSRWLCAIVHGIDSLSAAWSVRTYETEMQNQPSLIITKTLVPSKRSGLFHRPRLVDFIHGHIDRKLILISAAAGYGKTSVLVDFAHNTDLPVCWYTLDETDRDPNILVEYLVASIRRRFPEFGDRSLSVLRGTQGSASNLQLVVTAFVNEIHTAIPEYFVLILDDYHMVGDSRPVEAFFDLLFRYLPENCHVILASRTMAQLPLIRMAAYQEVTGLGSNELKFTGKEIQGLLKQMHNLNLPDAVAEELARESEGWITGILLTAQTFWRGMLENLAHMRGSPEQVYQYLATEVFAQEPGEVQRFLLASSVLRQMHPSLCNRLLGIENSGEIIDTIEEHNLFISRVEGQETWYKYHNLFQEFLRRRLQQENEPLFTELHLKAASLFDSQGDVGEAIHHYFAVRDYDDVRRRVAEAADSMFEAGRYETLAQWIDALPRDVFSSDPELLLIRARIHNAQGELHLARECLSRAETSLATTDNLRGKAQVRVYRGTVDALEGKYQSALENLNASLELLGPQTRGLPSVNSVERHGYSLTQADRPLWGLAGAAQRNLGLVLWAMGKLEEARSHLENALSVYEALGNAYYIANVQQELGNCFRAMGNLAGAHLHYQRALTLWEQIGNPAALANVLNSMAVGLYHRGDYDRALQVFETAMAKAQEGGNWRFQGYILAGMGDVHRDLGNYETCQRLYNSALDLATRVSDGRLTVYALDALGNTSRLRGDHAKALGLIRQAHSEASDHASRAELGMCETSLGILIYQTGEPDWALEHLQRACVCFEEANARLDLARVHFHLAQALYARRRWGAALEHLVSSLDISYQIGIDQFMMVEGQSTLPLLQFAVRRLDDQRIARLLTRIEEFRRTLETRSGRTETAPADTGVPGALEIFAFGKGTVYRNAALVPQPDWGAAQARELFFYLLAHPDRSKEQIGAVFWPDLSPDKMTSTFHATLYRVRRAVGHDAIVYDQERYRFTQQLNHWYDREEFEKLLLKAEQDGAGSDSAADCYRQAMALYRGDYLEGVYSDWATYEREALLNGYLDAIARLADYHADRKDPVEAIQLCQKLLELDSLREDAHRCLMECYALAGEPAKALQHYDRLVKLLAHELGVAPAPETIALHQQILQRV